MMKMNFYPFHWRVLTALFCLAMPLTLLATDVVVADANGNELTYSYDSADGPATFKSVKRYAADENKAGHIVIADYVTDANGVSHEVKYINGNIGNRYNIVSIVFGRNIVAVGGSDGSVSNAFYDCEKLESVTLNAKVEVLGRYCFQNCYKLSSINLSAATQLTTIKYYCFEDCDSLTSVTLPASVTTLEDYAFYNCDSLKEVKFTTGQSPLTFGKQVFRYCRALTTISLPQNIISLGESAFDYCSSLTTVTFNGKPALKEIPYNTFASCTSLESITLPDAVESIAKGAFYNCKSLREIFFGKSLTSLSDDYTVFGEYIPNLRKLVFPGANYPFKRSYALNSSDVTLYVHPDMVETYRTNDYSKLFHTIAIGKTTAASVSTSSGGQLESRVLAKGDPADLLELTVSGPINGTDINFLHQQLYNLEKLDLSNASIVAGGDNYTRWQWSDNVVSQSGSKFYPTEDNVVGPYMFYDMRCLRWLKLPSGITSIGEYAISQDRQHNLRFKLTYCPIPSGVKSIGQYAFYYTGITETNVPKGVTELSNGVFARCEKMQKATLPDGLKTIGNSVFSECHELEEVNMPSTVESIGEYAFYNNYVRKTPLVIPSAVKAIRQYTFMRNYELPSVKFNNTLESVGYEAFYQCHSIEQAVLPQTVTSIGESAFYDCDSLRSFTFPNSITQIPSSVLEHCDNLTKVVLASGTTKIGSYSFASCPKLVDMNYNQQTLTTIGRHAFANTGFTTVTLPNSITSMDYSAFRSCANLVSINVPTQLTTVPYDFVCYCSNLTSVKMHDGIRVIGHNAFLDCESLPTIELNDEITTIEYDAFNGCTSLVLTKLPKALTAIGSSGLRGTKLSGNQILPTGLTTIDNSAFRGTAITGVTLPTGITKLGSYVFDGCTSLASVKLPQDIVTIPSYTFRECTALETIDLPESITTIGSDAFAYSGLTSITLPENIQKIESSAFERTQLTTFRVPDGFTSDLGTYALYNCKQLRSVYFGRNQDYSQWSSFTAVYGCDSLTLMRVYAGTPPKSDTYNKSFRFNCVLEVPEDQVELYKQADFWKDFKEIKGIFMGDILADRDFALLQELYDKFGGANWEKPWDLSNNHHSTGKWTGVTTVRNSAVTAPTYNISSIDLSGLGLKGTLPTSIFRLPQLQKLNLSNNQLEGDITNIVDAQNAAPLTEVYLQGNRLTGDIYAFASRLPELTKLNLSYNCLTDISQPVSKEKLTNNNFVYNFQFVDINTHETIAPEGAPIIDVTVGVPTKIELNRLMTYRHNSQDYGFSDRDLGRIYYVPGYYGGWTVSWELYQTDELWNLYQSTGNNYRLMAKKGQPTAYALENGNYQTILLRFTWVDGDVNVDQTADVQDLQDVIYYALHDAKPSGQMYNFGAADDNSDDKINVVDITRSVDYVLGNSKPASSRALENDKVYGSSQNVLFTDGSSLSLTNVDEIAAMQFDVMGASLRDVHVSDDMRTRFSVAMSSVPGGVRVVFYSPTGNVLSAGTHQLLQQLPAGATVIETVLTDLEAHLLGVDMNGEVPTSILQLGREPGVDTPVYDLSGRRLGPWDTLPPGIYVVRMNGQQYKLKK